MIGVISLAPYWHTGVLLVSQGETPADILQFVDECHVADGNDKLFRKIHFAWKKLIRSKEVREGILKIDDKDNSIQATVFTEDYDGNPLSLLVLPKSFDKTNYENMITLAHECIHVCQDLLPKYLNRDEEQEAEAYFHSYLMRSIINLMEK